MRNDIVITCPCCSARLLVDAQTGYVREQKKSAKKEPAADPAVDPFGDALKTLSDAEKTADTRFKKALSSEGERGKKLDEFFEKAKQEVREDDDDTPPPSPFEFD